MGGIKKSITEISYILYLRKVICLTDDYRHLVNEYIMVQALEDGVTYFWFNQRFGYKSFIMSEKIRSRRSVGCPIYSAYLCH